MLYNVKIPKYFTIIQKREHVIELKSLYHYWRLTDNDDVIILAHKHKITDHYHKQFSCIDAGSAMRYIIRHDRYVKASDK